jgi:hypothetical protein
LRLYDIFPGVQALVLENAPLRLSLNFRFPMKLLPLLLNFEEDGLVYRFLALPPSVDG